MLFEVLARQEIDIAGAKQRAEANAAKADNATFAGPPTRATASLPDSASGSYAQDAPWLEPGEERSSRVVRVSCHGRIVDNRSESARFTDTPVTHLTI